MLKKAHEYSFRAFLPAESPSFIRRFRASLETSSFTGYTWIRSSFDSFCPSNLSPGSPSFEMKSDKRAQKPYHDPKRVHSNLLRLKDIDLAQESQRINEIERNAYFPSKGRLKSFYNSDDTYSGSV